MSISISIWHLSWRSSVHSDCQAARTPYSFIHSPHSFLDPDSCCKSCIRCTATTEPWLALWAPGRIWDRTGGLQVDRHTYTNKHVNITHTFLSHSHSIFFFMFAADWQLWPTCITEGKKKRKKVLLELEALTESNLAAKSVLKHKWQSVRAVLLQCLKSGKQDGLVWDETPLREEEEHACLLPIRDVGP